MWLKLKPAITQLNVILKIQSKRVCASKSCISSCNTVQTSECLISGSTIGVDTHCLQEKVILLTGKEVEGLNLN